MKKTFIIIAIISPLSTSLYGPTQAEYASYSPQEKEKLGKILQRDRMRPTEESFQRLLQSGDVFAGSSYQAPTKPTYVHEVYKTSCEDVAFAKRIFSYAHGLTKTAKWQAALGDQTIAFQNWAAHGYLSTKAYLELYMLAHEASGREPLPIEQCDQKTPWGTH